MEEIPWCRGERHDVDKDATGKERVAHLVRRKAPLRRERTVRAPLTLVEK